MTAYDAIREGVQWHAPSLNGGLDYVYSPSRIYIGVFQENGDFDVFNGESLDDPHKVKLWSSDSSRNMQQDWTLSMLQVRKGPFNNHKKTLQIFAHDNVKGSLQQLWSSGGSGNLEHPVEIRLGDDGRLTLWQGDQEVWSSGVSDPVVEFVVERIKYDIPKATLKTDGDGGVLEQILVNNTSIPQQMKMAKQMTMSTVSSWSNATGFSATVGGEVTAGVPGVASAKVTMSSSISNTFTLGGSKTVSSMIGFDFTLTVPPGKTYRGWATIREATFDVPYTVYGELRFRSGKKRKHTLSGIYAGESGYLGKYQVDEINEDRVIPIVGGKLVGPPHAQYPAGDQ